MNTYSLQMRFAPTQKDLIFGLLYEMNACAFQEGGVSDGTSAIPEEDSLITCFFESECALQDFHGRFSALLPANCPVEIEVSSFSTASWQDAWKEFAEPVEISPRLLVLPIGKQHPAKEGQLTLVIDSEQTFGSGNHETTRLCLEQIDQILQFDSVSSMLDVGCGSGVLAIAAAKLGVRDVLGIDLDDKIVATAKLNAERNDVSFARFSTTPLITVNQRYDLVAANILSSVLRDLWAQLLLRVATGGRLIISGLLVAEIDRFSAAVGIRNFSTATRGDWAALIIAC